MEEPQQTEQEDPTAAPPSPPPSSAARGQNSPRETNGDQGEKNGVGEERTHHPPPAAPQEKPDSGMQDASGGKQEHARADIRARKTSLTSTADGSMAGHDGYNCGQQGLQPDEDMRCCVIM
ncbi:uncharacterized protein LOC143296997 [Babylonia areolata]|uniref:uncharacterized protein LOC143296997 n=1 Tax=Babylonia areolata TaxID=304850 RepID=UPI003FD22848